jgi:exopolyphosphatase/guanosine-5'-triphosphate,3'-diphosphate pyrophosphatase
VVSLTESERIDTTDAKTRAQSYAKMRERVTESFAEFAARLPKSNSADYRLLGTSGTVTTLASLHLQLPRYDRKLIDGLIVPAKSMRDISAMLAESSPEERSKIPCIGEERADLVIGGCAILDCILEIWPAERVGVADRGIREGILRSLMSSNEQRANP